MKQRNALHCDTDIWPVFMRETHNVYIYIYIYIYIVWMITLQEDPTIVVIGESLPCADRYSPIDFVTSDCPFNDSKPIM